MKAPGSLFALATMLFAAPVAAEPVPPTAFSASDKSDTLCGVTADSVQAFRDKTAVDPRFRAEKPMEKSQGYASEALQALWMFVLDKHPAYPAAICRQVINRGNISALEMRIRCEAKMSACEDLYWEQKKLDDGSGD
jgi:hypothetical protein